MKIRTISATAIAVFCLAFGMLVSIANAEIKSVDAPVRALIEAMEVEDAVRIRAPFSPNATQAYGADG